MTEPVRARVGEEFELSFEATPTAGFAWEVDLPADAQAHVDLLKSEWNPDSERVGGHATQRFRFRALTPGRLTLHFRYRRRWEPTDSERCAVLIEVS